MARWAVLAHREAAGEEPRRDDAGRPRQQRHLPGRRPLRVVTDLHHSVLWESLALLFVDRAILGPAELFVWRDGHYQVRTGLATEEFGRRPQVVSSEWLAGLGADLVISTVGGTRGQMRDLAQRIGALYVDHVGNAWDTPIGRVVLRAAHGPGEAGVLYHPEFHRLPPSEPSGTLVGAFHASLPHMPECWALFQRVGGVLYGTAEHPLRPHEVAAARAACIAQWHCKDADGYGFGIHEAFAAGRAVIGHAEHYRGKLAEPLFVRGVTYLEPGDPLDDLPAIGRQGREHFDRLVDFDAEAQQVAEYLRQHMPGGS